MDWTPFWLKLVHAGGLANSSMYSFTVSHVYPLPMHPMSPGMAAHTIIDLDPVPLQKHENIVWWRFRDLLCLHPNVPTDDICLCFRHFHLSGLPILYLFTVLRTRYHVVIHHTPNASVDRLATFGNDWTLSSDWKGNRSYRCTDCSDRSTSRSCVGRVAGF